MPGKSHRFSAREDRQAAHIAASMRKQGKSAKQARSIGFATVVSRGGGKSLPLARTGGKRGRSKR